MPILTGVEIPAQKDIPRYIIEDGRLVESKDGEIIKYVCRSIIVYGPLFKEMILLSIKKVRHYSHDLNWIMYTYRFIGRSINPEGEVIGEDIIETITAVKPEAMLELYLTQYIMYYGEEPIIVIENGHPKFYEKARQIQNS